MNALSKLIFILGLVLVVVGAVIGKTGGAGPFAVIRHRPAFCGH